MPSYSRNDSRYTAGAHARPPAHATPRRKRSNAALVVGIVLLVAGLVAIGVSATLLFKTAAEYEVGNEEYASIVESAVVEDTVTGKPNVDFGALMAQNPEIVGWIQIPGTQVNYPVAQHGDNDYYLDHTFLGQYNLAGSVFMDCRSSSGLQDRVTVLYGHHLKNGAMFARVADYSDQAEFNTLGEVYYVSGDGVLHTLEPLCSIVVSGYDVDVLVFDFADENDFSSYVYSLIQRSSASAPNASPEGAQHIFILSTCSYGSENERTMLVCVEKGATPITDEAGYAQVADIQNAADQAAGIAPESE